MISTILLAEDNTYVKDGKLPVGRPNWDKDLLEALCTNEYISHAGWNILPRSIKKNANLGIEPTIGITIPEIAKSKLLLVVRAGNESNGGKKFRFTNFRRIVKTGQIEIWKKIR